MIPEIEKETLDDTLWRTRFGRVCGLVLRHASE